MVQSFNLEEKKPILTCPMLCLDMSRRTHTWAERKTGIASCPKAWTCIRILLGLQGPAGSADVGIYIYIHL